MFVAHARLPPAPLSHSLCTAHRRLHRHSLHPPAHVLLARPLPPLAHSLTLQLIGASTDTPEVHLAWIKTARKRGGLGYMQVHVCVCACGGCVHMCARVCAHGGRLCVCRRLSARCERVL